MPQIQPALTASAQIQIYPAPVLTLRHSAYAISCLCRLLYSWQVALSTAACNASGAGILRCVTKPACNVSVWVGGWVGRVGATGRAQRSSRGCTSEAGLQGG